MLSIFLKLAAAALAIGLVAGFNGSVHPVFDTIANFRWHFSVALILTAMALFVMRYKLAAGLLLGLAATGLYASSAGARFFTQEPVSTTSTSYRLLSFNLRFNNPQRDAVMRMIREHDPDILTLSEISRLWENDLRGLMQDYPYHFHCPEWSVIGGVMILSKFPMTEEPAYCHDYAAIGLAEVRIGDHEIGIGSVHLRWPWPASGPAQITAMSNRLQELGTDAIIAGDFNSASWTHSLKRFQEYSGARLVEGLGGTWMYKWFPASWAKWLGLPIDHVLVKGMLVTIRNAKTLPPAGSDHLPMLVEFTLDEANVEK